VGEAHFHRCRLVAVVLLEDHGIVVGHHLETMLVIGKVLHQYLELQMERMDPNPAVTAVAVAVAVEAIAEVPVVVVDNQTMLVVQEINQIKILHYHM
jgi:hypothetical protein